MTMTQQCLAEASCHAPRRRPWNHWMQAIIEGLGQGRRRRRDFVDLRKLPPYLQRDLGFVDGRKLLDD
jgi:hypothetical protein